jgi:hypothetical protein
MTSATRRAPAGGRGWALAVASIVALAAALRVPPLGVLVPGSDLQETYVRQAMLALAAGSWEPEWSWHGPGFFTILRAVFTVWYAVGWLAGWWADRVDMLADFFGSPYPFLLAARLIVVGSALATIAIVASLGRAVFGRVAGIAGALALAVMLSHVRESLQVWPDVPSAALVMAAVAVAYGGRHPLLAALLAGAAIACKHSAAPVVFPVALGMLAPHGTFVRRVLMTGAGLAAAYLVLGHSVVTHPQDLLATMRMQAVVSFGIDSNDLSLAQVVSIGIGWPLVALAAIGAGASLWRPDRRRTILLLAFPLAYLFTIAGAGRLFARYLVLAAPFIALFAGEGVRVVARVFGNRRGLAAAVVLVAACALPMRRSIAYVRLMTRADTRVLAGAWLAAHAPANAVVVLPHVLGAPHPAIPGVVSRRPGESPATRALIRAAHRRLQARGAPRFQIRTLGGLGRVGQVRFADPAIVVTAAHPVILDDRKFQRLAADALAQAGARRVATFDGVPMPLPAGVLFDPIDSDYTPLLGADLLERPGPNLTVWSVPARAGATGPRRSAHPPR